MAKVLVSLVSQQRVPNVLAIMDPYFGGVDRYLFISTPDMEEKGVVEHIQSATALSEGRCQRILVEPHDWQQILEQLTETALPAADEYHLNLTGGTKIMALATFSYFQQIAAVTHYYYLPITNNVIYKVGHGQQTQAIPVTYEIGVMEYLKSYGLAVPNANFSALLKPIKVSRQILRYHEMGRAGGMRSNYWDGIDPIRPLRGKEKSYKIDQHSQLRRIIQELEMPLLDEQILRPVEILYLTGGWFEEWVFQTVKEELQLSARMIARNLNIYWLGEEAKYGNNELDVVFMYKNTIHIIECKAGLGNRKMVKEQFTRAGNQLAVFSQKMGLRVEVAFVTLSRHLRDEKLGDLDSRYQARADVLSIQVLDGQDIEEKLLDYLDGLRKK